MGAKVALIERDRMGGDCLNFGCVPSKALLAAGHAAAVVRHPDAFGIASREPEVDFRITSYNVCYTKLLREGIKNGIRAKISSFTRKYEAFGGSIV